MKTPDIVMRIASKPRLLQSVRATVRTFLKCHGVPEDRLDELVLAVDEACTNSIRHAYSGDSEQKFELALDADGEWIEIEIRDEGATAPAEKMEKKAPAPAPDAETITPGGLGVQLIHDVFDDVQFSPGTPRGNCVTMRVRRPEDGAAPS